MAVLDIARQRVVTQAIDDTVADAVDSMREAGVSSVVLVDDENTPTGIVTARSIALQVGRTDSLAETELGNFETAAIQPVAADVGLYELLEHMAEHGARRVPVVDADGLAGIVSITDVVILLGMELQHVANVLRTDSPAFEHSPTDVYE